MPCDLIFILTQALERMTHTPPSLRSVAQAVMALGDAKLATLVKLSVTAGDWGHPDYIDMCVGLLNNVAFAHAPLLARLLAPPADLLGALAATLGPKATGGNGEALRDATRAVAAEVLHSVVATAMGPQMATSLGKRCKALLKVCLWGRGLGDAGPMLGRSPTDLWLTG